MISDVGFGVAMETSINKYDPLKRIISFDDFDRGFCGWGQLVGNYEQSLDSMNPNYQQHTHPQLSNLSHWDSGSHGSWDGTYALKIQTRPITGSRNVSVKRLTFRKASRIRLEFYFTFKPEATELLLSETDVRSVGFLFDLQDPQEGGNRVMPHIRFLNAENGEHVQKWQFKRKAPAVTPVGTDGKTITHDHLASEDWEDLPNGHQKLCYNEIPTKVNWHYLRFDFDLANMQMKEMQCNDRVFDLSQIESMKMPAMRNLWCMLNVALFTETDTDKRSLYYIDSVCLSGDF
jgi:hypothetical protein